MAESDQSSDGGSDAPAKGAGERAPDKLTLAPELIQARERLGLTQAQLATESGLSLASIKGYETGRTLPGARELRQLCTALHITPNKLIFGDEAPFSGGQAGEVFAGPYGVMVHRNRIKWLVPYLTSDEAASFCSLMSALVLARHGKDEVQGAEESADLMTGFEVISKSGPFVADLFRLITRDPSLARQVAEALKKAAAVATGDIQDSEEDLVWPATQTTPSPAPDEPSAPGQSTSGRNQPAPNGRGARKVSKK